MEEHPTPSIQTTQAQIHPVFPRAPASHHPRKSYRQAGGGAGREVSHHLAVGGSEAVGQLAQAAQVALEARQLGGRGMVGLTQRLAGVGLLLPQAGAEREQQVTGQQLDHLQEPRCPGTGF